MRAYTVSGNKYDVGFAMTIVSWAMLIIFQTQQYTIRIYAIGVVVLTISELFNKEWYMRGIENGKH